MSDKPIRIQRKRARGWRMPPNTVSVTRPSIFGNPFPSDIYGPELACDLFRRWLSGNMSVLERTQLSRCDRYGDMSLGTVRLWLLDKMPTLRGKNLACFCALGQACHADVLLKLANQP